MDLRKGGSQPTSTGGAKSFPGPARLQQFPERYRGGAFIAFHGSWNRAPLPQEGYIVSFVPFEAGAPTGNYETFADGFAGVEPIPGPGAAEYRPMGLAVGPDGAIYISDSKEGASGAWYTPEEQMMHRKATPAQSRWATRTSSCKGPLQRCCQRTISSCRRQVGAEARKQ